ncbi:MAG: lysine--tRNA ligase, partial [Candidatus Nanopelagicales bacterium]
GKLCFATLRDWTGDLQVMISLNEAGEENLAAWKSDVDLGDIVGVTGQVITSKRGELSVLATDFVITSKCLVPLPDKHKGLNDPEARVRQRYVDLIVNPDAREMLTMRSEMVRAIREQLWSREYLEVETPMMQRVHGGANARPFITHINAYDMKLYMRIAPELFLKRLLVGGVEKVFELNRNFRNEGADSTHNPEFTSMEMYDAYGNYDTMRVLTRELILAAATAVHGSPKVLRPIAGAYDGSQGYEEVDISGDWPVVTVHNGISLACGEEVTVDTELPSLARIMDQAGIPRNPNWGTAKLIEELYEHFCEDRTTTPVFYTDFPTEVSPLTRKKPSEPRLAERWDLVAWGAELGTAYTELIDPLDQRDRLTAQSLLAAAGDSEAMEVDEDFLRALEYGMPPAGGQGMGIDRLLMLLTGRNIRESVLFPLTRPDTSG